MIQWFVLKWRQSSWYFDAFGSQKCKKQQGQYSFLDCDLLRSQKDNEQQQQGRYLLSDRDLLRSQKCKKLQGRYLLLDCDLLRSQKDNQQQQQGQAWSENSYDQFSNESKEVYQRQVLSISCITIGISLLGTLCVAFYCRNKRRKEKLQAHLKDSHSLKSYSLNTSSLMSKSTLRPQSYCKAPVPSPALGGSVHESSFSHGGQSPHTRISQKVKQHRSNSLSHSPDQRSRATHRFAPRRTPPLPHGRLNPIGGARDSGPAYQHLQEAEPSEKEAVQEGPMCSPAALPPSGQQQEVALLLHTAHEQLRVLAHAHRKCEDCSPVLPASFMSSAIRRGGVAKATPAETQLVHPRGPHKDNSPSCQ
ncbi:Pro-neuregulin-3, membrane-bound isoform [Acipenser ruthenus]|uniref:Pro-neuregulin-3, membrane-bound isoform n=1 Tax=Acipenser ruthenus TaxID=7906 RepID=A0A444U3T5_ACIRT|nr:Pro-neuregulin-3, membrane-bound isoform [Acipenser ruthenus]